MIALAVNGAAGRMGRALAELARERPDLRIVGGLDRAMVPVDQATALGYPRIVSGAPGDEVIAEADVVLDFSAPEGLVHLLDEHAPTLAGKALVVGTTGLGEVELARLVAAEMDMAVLTAANFSIGINLLLQLVEEAARTLPADRYDAEIVEAHHRRKTDAPSGTALALGRALAAGRGVSLDEHRLDGRSGQTGERPDAQIGFHAIRGGDVVGEHRVLFLGGRERIELAHSASDRKLFAEGALQAAAWIAGKAPGRYTMAQVLAGP